MLWFPRHFSWAARLTPALTGGALGLALLAGVLRCIAADGNATVAAPASSGSVSVPALAPRTVPGIDLTLLPIPAGSFTMGSPSYPRDPSVLGPETKVTLTQAFWLGKYAVTQGQWKLLMGTDVIEQARRMLADDSLYFLKGKQQTMRDFLGVAKDSDPKVLIGKAGDNDPIYWVSWDEAATYCRKLTERERSAGRLPAGYEYRLPTDAEWEYACSMRTMRPIYRERNSSAVYTDPAVTENPWGLYDMLSDMGQWCGDWYADKLPGGNVTDPHGAEKGSIRVYHDGKWRSTGGKMVRAALRSSAETGTRISDLSFRVALAPME